jgi:hypothetical protein
VVLVPEVDPGLVADLDVDAEVAEDPARSADDLVLGLPREVRRVVVDDVVVADAPLGVVAVEDVPDGLEQRAGREVAVGEVEDGQPVEDLDDLGVLADRGEEVRLGGRAQSRAS